MDHSRELLDRIRAQGIRPVPRWRVRLRRAGVAALFAGVVLLGTLSVTLAVQEIHAHAGRGWMFRRVLSDWAPFVWSLTAALLVFAGIRVFRELPRGWRVRPWHVGVSIATVCLAGGWGLERTDALLGLHRAVAMRIPSYRAAWMEKAMASWHDPASGRISGRWVGAVDSTRVLESADGVRWTVRWEGAGRLPETPSIRLMGEVCGPSLFCATDWRPAPGSGGFRRGR